MNRPCQQHSDTAKLSWDFQKYIVKTLFGINDCLNSGVKKRHCWVLYSAPFFEPHTLMKTISFDGRLREVESWHIWISLVNPFKMQSLIILPFHYITLGSQGTDQCIVDIPLFDFVNVFTSLIFQGMQCVDAELQRSLLNICQYQPINFQIFDWIWRAYQILTGCLWGPYGFFNKQ